MILDHAEVQRKREEIREIFTEEYELALTGNPDHHPRLTELNLKRNTLEREVAAFDERVRAEHNQNFDAGNEPSEVPEVSVAGIDLLKPPGLAGAICEYMTATARRPMPELYPLAALHLMALIGRKRKSQYADKLNLTTLGIALTAAGKDHAQQTVIELAQEHYCSNLVAGDAGSFKELILNQLDGDGAALYIVDEVHSFLGSMKNKNAATYETKMEAEILKLSTTKLYVFRGAEKRHFKEVYEKQIACINKQIAALGNGESVGGLDADMLEKRAAKISNRLAWIEDGMPDPFFSLMGHSVPENLDSFISLENIGSGFLGRALIVRCPDTRRELVRDIDQGSHTLMLCKSDIKRGLSAVRNSDSDITAAPAARDYMNKCIDWYENDQQRNHPVLGGIYARASEQVMRVASILALAEGQISLSHAKYANALVKQSIDDVSYILLKAYAETGEAKESAVFESARQLIHRSCKGQGVTPSRLKQLVQKPKGWQALQEKDVTRDIYGELIDALRSRGELELHEKGRSVRYISRAVA